MLTIGKFIATELCTEDTNDKTRRSKCRTNERHGGIHKHTRIPIFNSKQCRVRNDRMSALVHWCVK